MDDPTDIKIDLSNDLERKIADVFDIFDHAGAKAIDSRDLGTVIRAMGCVPSEAEVQEMLLLTEDAESPGIVHLVDLIPHLAQAIIEHKYEPASVGQLLDVFHVLDEAGVGYLTREEITNIVTQQGDPFTQDELDEMLEIAIEPQTQTVPYEYYINQLMYELDENSIYALADKIVREAIPTEKKKVSIIFKNLLDIDNPTVPQ